MSADSATADEAIREAYRALQRGDTRGARQWAHQAAVLAPEREESWLAMAAVATPRASVEYLGRALEINPGSQRATAGMRWALERVRAQNEAGSQKGALPRHTADLPPYARHPSFPFTHVPAALLILLIPLAGLAALALTFWTVWATIGPTVLAASAQQTGPQLSADARATLLSAQGVSPTPFLPNTRLPAAAPTSRPVLTPTSQPVPTSRPAPTSVPAQSTAIPLSGNSYVVQSGDTLSDIAAMFGVNTEDLIQANQILDPSVIMPGQTLVIPRSGSGAGLPAPTRVPTSAPPSGPKSIIVDLSQQHLYAYQGNTLVYSFVASSGRSGASTWVGSFSILDKISKAWSPDWGFWMPDWMGIYWVSSDLENGIHALPVLQNGQTIWGSSLGSPISYGCIVLGTQNAEQLFYWAAIGTPVVIRY